MPDLNDIAVAHRDDVGWVRRRLLESDLRAAGKALVGVEESPVELNGLMGEVTRLALLYDHRASAEWPRQLIRKRPRPDWILSERLADNEVAAYGVLTADSRTSQVLPRVYGTAGDVDYRDLLLEDLREYQAVTQLDGLSQQQINAALGAVATLHQVAWEAGPVAPVELRSHPIVEFCADALSQYTGAWPQFLKVTVDILINSLEEVIDEISDNRGCLVHGDFHAGNLFFGATGVKLIDLQLLSVARPEVDLARIWATSQSTQQRRLNSVAFEQSYASSRGLDSWTLDTSIFRAALTWNLAVPLTLHVHTMDARSEWPRYLPILERCQQAIDDMGGR